MDEDSGENILYGTPLPDIDDDAGLKKLKAKESQVFDEKGRQRFHGAFTGGFSAGYFNTVGTKEGWAPSSFVSSRKKVAEPIRQIPEDFMDDEDFGEFGIATRKITTTSNFHDAPSKRLKLDKTDAVIPGEAPLMGIVRAVRESIGIKILKKLGWTEGQGIGSQLSKENSARKVYGCSLYPEDHQPYMEDHLALVISSKEDTESVYYQPKDDVFGLGYKSLSKTSILSESSISTSSQFWLPKDKKKLSIRGQAFGVGAFEEEDADIYGKDDMSQYDFSELETPLSKVVKKPDSKKQTQDDVIEGFRLGSPYFGAKRYEPPPLPPNFRVHLKIPESTVKSSQEKIPRHVLSASDRSLLLGEREIRKPVFDSGTSLFQNKSPPTSSDVSKFKPFQTDPSKQERYEEYLKLAKQGEIEKLVQPSSMTEWEKQQELQEFARSSMIFKPMANILSSRFESRSHLSVEHEIMSAMEKSKQEKKEKPASKSLIGTKNRKLQDWIPHSLLCKRFNVPNPFPNAPSASDSSKSKSIFTHLSFSADDTYKKEKSSDLETQKDDDLVIINKSTTVEKSAPAEVKERPSQNSRPPIDFFKDIFENSSSDEEEEETRNDPATSVLQSQDNDLATTSKSADSLNSNNEKTQSVQPSVNNTDSQEPKKANKVGFGVFANIDLDSLKVPKPASQNTELKFRSTEINDASKSFSEDVKSSKPSEAVPKMDVYGPEIPPNFTIPVSSNECKRESKKHVKHKSKHKHKDHKHKKSKKKKKHHSSDSDSLNELDDIPPSLIIEKLKKLKGKS